MYVCTLDNIKRVQHCIIRASVRSAKTRNGHKASDESQ